MKVRLTFLEDKDCLKWKDILLLLMMIVMMMMVIVKRMVTVTVMRMFVVKVS